MVVTDVLLCPSVRIKDELMESDNDTLDTQTDNSSCPSSPTPEISPSNKSSILPMDTVILVAKAKDGSKKSLVFRSLLRNRRAPGRIEKIRIIKTSPVADIKHASLPMRANLKLQLDRQQLYQQEKREQQFPQSFKVNNNHLLGSTGISIPTVLGSTQVPATVLQVKTQLQHPTKYHVQASQKRQVQDFLNSGHHGAHMPIQSLPANQSVSTQQHGQYHIQQASNSAPQTVMTNSFLGGPSLAEFNRSNFDLIEEIQSGEQLELSNFLDDTDLIEIEPTIGESMRDDISQSGLLPPYIRLDDDGIASCPTAAYGQQSGMPAGMSMQDDMWRKDRIRKDNHNIIERRRRFNINDRIKELGGLLPKTIDPDLRQNKGTILKASVDYIRSLQEDQRRFRVVIEQKKKADNDLRKVLLRLNQMQFLIKSHGIENPLVNDVKLIGSHNPNMPTEHSGTTQISAQNSHAASVNNTPSFSSLLAGDELMDDCFPVCGDPMLLSDSFCADTDEQSLFFGHFPS